jgi:hypothetical protein
MAGKLRARARLAGFGSDPARASLVERNGDARGRRSERNGGVFIHLMMAMIFFVVGVWIKNGVGLGLAEKVFYNFCRVFFFPWKNKKMVCPAHESMQAMWGRYVSQVLLEKGALLFRERKHKTTFFGIKQMPLRV